MQWQIFQNLFEINSHNSIWEQLIECPSEKCWLVSWSLKHRIPLVVGLKLLSFVGSHSQQYRLPAQTGLVICGMGEDSLFSSLSWSPDWDQAGNSFVLTGKGSPSEEEESNFVMSYLPQNRLRRIGRRGSSVGADTGVWWELKYPAYAGNITSMIMLLSFNGE